MGEIKDYVFYIITKKDERYGNEGYSYGIERDEIYLRHRAYLAALINSEPYFFEDIPSYQDWVRVVEKAAECGNVIIANTAIEIEKVENRMYGIYLPSELTDYQIKELNSHMDEINSLDIDVDVQGTFRQAFIKKRIMNDFDSHAFLKEFLMIQDNKFSKENKVYQKVMY